MILAPKAWLPLLLACSACATAGSLEVVAATPEGKPIEDFAVVLEAAAPSPTKKTKSAIIQRDREFNPYLTIIQTGTAIEFPNRDPFKHHVYSFSQPKMFEIKLYAGKPAKPVVFDKPGVVALGCNIHDWMEAYVLVVDTPYFGKTGQDGRAHLDNIPEGVYRLRYWHPRLMDELPTRELRMGNENVRLTLKATVPPRPAHNKPPLEGSGY